MHLHASVWCPDDQVVINMNSVFGKPSLLDPNLSYNINNNSSCFLLLCLMLHVRFCRPRFVSWKSCKRSAFDHCWTSGFILMELVFLQEWGGEVAESCIRKEELCHSSPSVDDHHLTNDRKHKNHRNKMPSSAVLHQHRESGNIQKRCTDNSTR